MRISEIIARLALLGVVGCEGHGRPSDLVLATDACNVRDITSAIAAGAEVNPKDAEAPNPLRDAVAQGCIEGVRILIAAGADVNAQGNISPLMIASHTYRPEIAKVLIAAGADVNARDTLDQTALMWAVNDGDAPVAQVLIDAKADVNAKDRAGRTALYETVRVPNPALANILIDGGADVNISDGSETVLANLRREKTGRQQELQVEKLLLAHGAHE